MRPRQAWRGTGGPSPSALGDLPLEDAPRAEAQLPGDARAPSGCNCFLRHVPDRYEHLVRYVGWYSNRAPGPCAASAEIVSELVRRAKATWARLIRKVYEAAPLEWPVMATY